MIIRVERREYPYVQIDKRPLEDARLSWRAKGILAYLISKPNNWTIQTEDIVKHGTEGRDAVRSAMAELRDCGYAKLETTKGEDGRVAGKSWVISEISRLPENPSVGKTVRLKTRLPENPSLSNNEEESKNKRSNNEGKDASLVRMREEVLKEWNALGLHTVANLSAGRVATLNSRMKEAWWKDHWREALRMIPSSSFLTGKAEGRNGGKPFKASFDFFIRPDTVAKIIEGKYHGQVEQTVKRLPSAADALRAMGVNPDDRSTNLQ